MTCSDQAEQGREGAAARDGRRVVSLPCLANLYRSSDAAWQAAQRLKRAAYEAHRRWHTEDYRVRQLEINPLLKDWLL